MLDSLRSSYLTLTHRCCLYDRYHCFWYSIHTYIHIYIHTVVYCSIIYWSVGLNPIFTRFVVFTVTIVLNTFCALAIGFCVSAASPTSVIALAIGPPVLIIFLLFGKSISHYTCLSVDPPVSYTSSSMMMIPTDRLYASFLLFD